MSKKFSGFPGAGGGMNMNAMMKRVEQMQAEVQRSQQELEQKVFEEQSGGGAVKVAMDGTYTVRTLKISPDVLSDVEMLQDLLVAAINGVTTQIADSIKDSMKKATGGMNIPGLF